MADFTTAESFGFSSPQTGAQFGVSPEEFQQRWPALAFAQGADIAGQVGLDPSPQNVLLATRSRTYQNKATSLQEKVDERALQRILKRVGQTYQFNPNESPEQAAVGAAQMGIDARNLNLASRGILARQLASAEAAGQAADFNKDLYKIRRMKELSSDDEIDQQIAQLTIQAVTAQSALRSKYKNLHVDVRRAIEDSRMKLFSDEIGRLQDLKRTRNAAISDQIDEEIAIKEEDQNQAKSRVAALKSIIQTIEDSGQDTEALAGLREDLAKAQKKLGKSRAGANGYIPAIDVVYNQLLDQYTNKFGKGADGNTKSELKRQADQYVKQQGDVRSRGQSGPIPFPQGIPTEKEAILNSLESLG